MPPWHVPPGLPRADGTYAEVPRCLFTCAQKQLLPIDSGAPDKYLCGHTFNTPGDTYRYGELLSAPCLCRDAMQQAAQGTAGLPGSAAVQALEAKTSAAGAPLTPCPANPHTCTTHSILLPCLCRHHKQGHPGRQLQLLGQRQLLFCKVCLFLRLQGPRGPAGLEAVAGVRDGGPRCRKGAGCVPHPQAGGRRLADGLRRRQHLLHCLGAVWRERRSCAHCDGRGRHIQHGGALQDRWVVGQAGGRVGRSGADWSPLNVLARCMGNGEGRTQATAYVCNADPPALLPRCVQATSGSAPPRRPAGQAWSSWQPITWRSTWASAGVQVCVLQDPFFHSRRESGAHCTHCEVLPPAPDQWLTARSRAPVPPSLRPAPHPHPGSTHSHPHLNLAALLPCRLPALVSPPCRRGVQVESHLKQDLLPQRLPCPGRRRQHHHVSEPLA